MYACINANRTIVIKWRSHHAVLSGSTPYRKSSHHHTPFSREANHHYKYWGETCSVADRLGHLDYFHWESVFKELWFQFLLVTDCGLTWCDQVLGMHGIVS